MERICGDQFVVKVVVGFFTKTGKSRDEDKHCRV